MDLLTAHKTIRNNALELVQNLSEKQLSTIPKGFNNTIYWNIAHSVVTQQLLVYYLSGNTMILDGNWIENFKKGSFAKKDNAGFDKADLVHIINQTNAQFEKDVNNQIFTQYTEYTTSFGFKLHNVQDAMLFNNMHESLHFGYAMAMRKLV